IEFLNLVGIVANRQQSLHTHRQLTLGVFQAGLQCLVAAGLPNDAFDLYQVLPVFQLTAQLQGIVQEIQTLQLVTGANKLLVRVACQIEVGQQHRNKEKHTDQAEFHGETQAIHQCNGGAHQAAHETSPNFLLLCVQHQVLLQGSSERCT